MGMPLVRSAFPRAQNMCALWLGWGAGNAWTDYGLEAHMSRSRFDSYGIEEKLTRILQAVQPAGTWISLEELTQQFSSQYQPTVTRLGYPLAVPRSYPRTTRSLAQYLAAELTRRQPQSQIELAYYRHAYERAGGDTPIVRLRQKREEA